jgi:hypothetical protein
MSEIDVVLYEYVKSIHVIYTDLFCIQASTALCIFMSTHANSWIKVVARQNIIWIRFGNRRAIWRRRAEAGMALTAIGEFTQWGGVADCSGSRTHRFYTRIDHQNLSGCHKHRCSQHCIGSTREIGDGWPLLTVETVVNGNSKRTNERGPFLVGSLGLSYWYKRILFCLDCSSRLSTKYFFPHSTLFQQLSSSPSKLVRQPCWVACL